MPQVNFPLLNNKKNWSEHYIAPPLTKVLHNFNIKNILLLLFAGKLYDVGYRLGLNRKYVDPKLRNHAYYANYASGFDVPFYIGLINIGANRDKNQWRWSSTGRSLSKNILGEKNTTKIEGEHSYLGINWEYRLIKWAKGANGLKLHGDCAFINNDAELKDIDSSTKLTIICEEV